MRCGYKLIKKEGVCERKGKTIFKGFCGVHVRDAHPGLKIGKL